MDDEDEVAEMNLSSRPGREERRRTRERERLERGMERCVSHRFPPHASLWRLRSARWAAPVRSSCTLP